MEGREAVGGGLAAAGMGSGEDVVAFEGEMCGSGLDEGRMEEFEEARARRRRGSRRCEREVKVCVGSRRPDMTEVRFGAT